MTLLIFKDRLIQCTADNQLSLPLLGKVPLRYFFSNTQTFSPVSLSPEKTRQIEFQGCEETFTLWGFWVLLSWPTCLRGMIWNVTMIINKYEKSWHKMVTAQISHWLFPSLYKCRRIFYLNLDCPFPSVPVSLKASVCLSPSVGSSNSVWNHFSAT